ncbi:mitochondrial aldehyde dehydrogenase [Fusarium piperis]|uniref:aldehyde dehydrogenase (NAD(+)) n=1 Tax=Fusarium piperis TaxID=1435070 RepID=A0A9W8WM73_9HYPO|nr:mitochondrial aldehyde dehydrogenase [Fusarium piperis]
MHITQLFLIIANGLLQVVAQTPTTTERPSGPFSPYQTPRQRALSSVIAKMTGRPAPGEAISDIAISFAIGEYHNTQDPCQLPVVTGSSASLLSDWASSWTSWQSENIPKYKEIWTACSEEPRVGEIVPVGPNVCSKIAAKITEDDDKNTTETAGKSTLGDKEGKGSREASTQNEETSPGTNAQSEATSTEGDSPGCRQTGSLVNLELPAAIGCIRYYAGWADKLHGQTIPTHSKKFAYTIKQPIGVWTDYSLELSCLDGDVEAGSGSCDRKHDRAEAGRADTPLSMLYVADLVVRAGFPPGVVNIINGYGRTAGHSLVSHPDVAKIAFTGSTITGRLIQQTAATTLKKVTLETGGKSPLLVFNDADTEQAARWAHCGIMSNQGQICTANSRLLVQSGVYEQFIRRFVELVEAHKIGNPFDGDTFQGPQITKEHLDKILSHVKGAVKEGATLETGGEAWGDKGFFMQPTVFSNVSSSMKIYREEIFGPVVVISSFDREEQAINMASDSEFGLAASVFTRDMQWSHRVSTRLDVGMTLTFGCHLEG